MKLHGSRLEFSVAPQVGLMLAQVSLIELVLVADANAGRTA